MAETSRWKGRSELAVREEEEKLLWGRSEDWFTEKGVRSLDDLVQISFFQVHVYTHLFFSYLPSISEWHLKLRSITSPWEIWLLKLSSQSTCLSFAHACLIRAIWVPTSLNETGIGEQDILWAKLLCNRLYNCTSIFSHKSIPCCPDFRNVSPSYSHKWCEKKFWEKKRPFNWRPTLQWDLARGLVEAI